MGPEGPRRGAAVSGICSRHQGHDPECDLCAIDPREALGGERYDEKAAEAEAAGLHRCECGFEYYRTVSFCPKCHRNLPGAEQCPVHEFYDHGCLGCRRGAAKP